MRTNVQDLSLQVRQASVTTAQIPDLPRGTTEAVEQVKVIMPLTLNCQYKRFGSDVHYKDINESFTRSSPGTSSMPTHAPPIPVRSIMEEGF